MMLRQLFSFYFFYPQKAFGFFSNSLELVSLLTHATYCFGTGLEEATTTSLGSG